MAVQIGIKQAVEIPGSDPKKYTLALNGRGKNGAHHGCKPGDYIRWKVLGASSNVVKISGITWKELDGSTDIFTQNKPESDGDTEWLAKADDLDDVHIYIYSIKFFVRGDTAEYETDPIIALKPSSVDRLNFFTYVLCAVGLSFLVTWSMARMKYKQEIQNKER